MGTLASLSDGLAHPVPASAVPDLRKYYDALFTAHGPQHWWPGRSRFEVIVGAILTQNTSWSNVEPALRNLRSARLLAPAPMLQVPLARLQSLIRSSGYFRQKARKLKAFAEYLQTMFAGSLTRMFRTPTTVLREQLLGVHGIGPEAADSILLYAGGHPIFVIDAYTRRIVERHQLTSSARSYEQLRALFERSLPPDAALYNEFHALIVRTGKLHCRARQPRCNECPLREFLPANTSATI